MSFTFRRHRGIISPPNVWSVSSHTPAWSPTHGSWPPDGTRETFPPWTVPGTLAGSAASVAGEGTCIQYIHINTRAENHSLRGSAPPSWPLLFHLLLREDYETSEEVRVLCVCIKSKLMFTFSPFSCKPNPAWYTYCKYCASSLNNELEISPQSTICGQKKSLWFRLSSTES